MHRKLFLLLYRKSAPNVMPEENSSYHICSSARFFYSQLFILQKIRIYDFKKNKMRPSIAFIYTCRINARNALRFDHIDFYSV